MKTPLREKFEHIVHEHSSTGKDFRVLVTVTRVPAGALETQVNYENLWDKVDYIRNAYGDDFKMKNNPSIEIVDFILL